MPKTQVVCGICGFARDIIRHKRTFGKRTKFWCEKCRKEVEEYQDVAGVD